MIRPALVALSVFIISGARAADLPDPVKTPGVVRTDMDLATMCSTKWGKDHRFVTDAMKAQVFKEYGLTGNGDPYCQPGGCEVDHLISRELLGADDVLNLWIQRYTGPWNARLKDRVENRLHVEVCKGTLPLAQAQTELKTDWRVPYARYFGQPSQ